MATWVVVIGWLISTVWLVSGLDLDSVMQNLTVHSSRWVRPVRSWDRALLVHIDLQLLAVLDLVNSAPLAHFLSSHPPQTV
ncbi:hypothetical protein AAFF_G00306990 [Aldrovandia affinis]|uniref:Secreted protein n=1 Tax=Aldrovandia affinis TaxID=143900 RepID=A0AAD7R8K0_9TELE|nr:hypothetical protein AAFF_G00306990 [Aldrovandia affinis]